PGLPRRPGLTETFATRPPQTRGRYGTLPDGGPGVRLGRADLRAKVLQKRHAKTPPAPGLFLSSSQRLSLQGGSGPAASVPRRLRTRQAESADRWLAALFPRWRASVVRPGSAVLLLAVGGPTLRGRCGRGPQAAEHLGCVLSRRS